MTKLLTILAFTGLALLPAAAEDKAFRAIIGDAANIEQDAESIKEDLDDKNFDPARLKADVDMLGEDIAALRKDVEYLDAHVADLTPAQREAWDLVKVKIQLLTIFHERKADLLKGDARKNRAMMRAHADGIARRARLLQETANRLDR